MGRKQESNWEKKSGDICGLSFQHLLLPSTLPSQELLISISKWLQDDIPGSCWHVWPKLSQSKHSMPQAAEIKAACALDVVRDSQDASGKDVINFLPLDGVVGQGEVCGDSNHFSSGNREKGRESSLRTKKWSWNCDNRANFCTHGLPSHMVQ